MNRLYHLIIENVDFASVHFVIEFPTPVFTVKNEIEPVEWSTGGLISV